MYSERDMHDINARIRRGWMGLLPVLVAIAGAYVYALAARVQWLALVSGPLLAVAFCYGFLAHLWPNLRYREFLRGMESGLSRDLRGTVVAISETPEPQDGAMVLPVRVRLDANDPGTGSARITSVATARLSLESEEDTQDERIVYLNASKRDQIPGPGSEVVLHCYGRHIRSAEATQQDG